MSDQPKLTHLGGTIITRTKIHAVADPPSAEVLTLCGLGPSPGPMGVTSEPGDVTCAKCLELLT